MSNKKRVMWLLNHTTARKFEVPMLKECGFDEVFLPKSYPNDPSFRSASVDWSEDENLTIPPADLEVLNSTDWYSGGTKQAWGIANKWFDTVFFIVYSAGIIKNLANHFTGVCVLRAYGLFKPLNYSKLLSLVLEGKDTEYIRRMGSRFVLGIAYDHLGGIEPPILKDKAIYFPLGMINTKLNKVWTGEKEQILFICPDISISDYYHKVYKDFIKEFNGFNYIIAGSQPIKVMDKRVLGYVTLEEHNKNMRDSRVMFYHSQEPNHVHFHPFEAVKNGMPLVFMAGGLLDKLGGINLPGRCKNIKEAKVKIKAILNGDKNLINKIIDAQSILLDVMNFEKLKPFWMDGIAELLKLKKESSQTSRDIYINKKIAVILPVGYLGGSLRGAQMLASTIKRGSELSGDNCQVIFYHIESNIYDSPTFTDLGGSVSIRPFKWKEINAKEAIRAMEYAGYEGWQPNSNYYIIPDDGINYGFDCDLWLIVSDRVEAPLLPIKPVAFMVYDYLQRRNDFLEKKNNRIFIDAVRRSDKVLVTSEFTYQDALQYGGVKQERLSKVPMLIPDFSSYTDTNLASVFSINNQPKTQGSQYFLWTTNSDPHKNLDKIFEALKIYYETHNGSLKCLITGVNTASILQSKAEHIKKAKSIYSSSNLMRANIIFKGNLPDDEYKSLLKSSEFLLHSANGDNGTFSVVEAAFYGIPSLSNFYPAIDEMNKNYNLGLSYFNVSDKYETALEIKNMELNSSRAKLKLPSIDSLKKHTYEKHAAKYWEELKDLL
ncbi:glycosytransferase [Serratia sp. S1B]|nr:glycosytransferase [Serratia sp. S1B]